MNYRFLFYCLGLLGLSLVLSCKKWQDKPADNIGLTNKYCNNPAAINYNYGFPGVEDSTVCIFPTEPFSGNYTFQDSVYMNADTPVPGQLIHFTIKATNRIQITVNNFCTGGSTLFFTTNRYYRAETDSIIGAGTQLMCRTEDTLSGTMDYRITDSSVYLELKVVSDTGTSIHRGRAYKK